MIPNLPDKLHCCGCGACANSCAQQAIEMKYDEEGFIYPVVDAEKCVGCGVCEKTCPNTAALPEEKDYLKTYGGYSGNPEVMAKCTSGGFATELSRWMVKRGGVVYGVTYDESYIGAHYVRVTDEAGLRALMGSKYVQAEKKDIYRQVKADLAEGAQVLFVGCPCDVAALKLFLRKEYDNLYTCELVCMGVTSYKIAEDYKVYTEKKNRSKLTYINARSKAQGWFVPQLEEHFENGKVKVSTLFGTYYGYGFQVYNRPSCFACSYRDKSGVADFRVGDFWGIKESDPFWNPNGVSCIFVRSERGLDLLKELEQNGFQLYETDYDTATVNNMSSKINKPAKYVALRHKFAEIYQKEGLLKACKATETFSVKVKRLAPKKAQKFLKKVYHMLRDTKTK